MSGNKGIIFDIQHFSIHDGPGIRSTIFFKGCPLSCLWCSNPESHATHPQIMYYQHLCTGCGACVDVCRNKALIKGDDAIEHDKIRCSACGVCAGACLYKARIHTGKVVDVDTVCDTIHEHWRIFMQSGGGVTCSGGEVFMQPDFLRAILYKVHDVLGLHSCIETSGYTRWESFASVLPLLDLVFLDIKHMDNEKHMRATGKPNGLILENARKLADSNVPVIIRFPLIPGFNDSVDDVRDLGVFLQATGLRHLEIMPYHALGVSKYAALGKKCRMDSNKAPRVDAAVAILQKYGIKVEVHQL